MTTYDMVSSAAAVVLAVGWLVREMVWQKRKAATDTQLAKLLSIDDKVRVAQVVPNASYEELEAHLNLKRDNLHAIFKQRFPDHGKPTS